MIGLFPRTGPIGRERVYAFGGLAAAALLRALRIRGFALKVTSKTLELVEDQTGDTSSIPRRYALSVYSRGWRLLIFELWTAASLPLLFLPALLERLGVIGRPTLLFAVFIGFIAVTGLIAIAVTCAIAVDWVRRRDARG